jgi:hypothetical protein
MAGVMDGDGETDLINLSINHQRKNNEAKCLMSVFNRHRVEPEVDTIARFSFVFRWFREKRRGLWFLQARIYGCYRMLGIFLGQCGVLEPSGAKTWRKIGNIKIRKEDNFTLKLYFLKFLIFVHLEV